MWSGYWSSWATAWSSLLWLLKAAVNVVEDDEQTLDIPGCLMAGTSP